ncbi:hypothetical protein C7N43_01710 [Sphingobacteriales bacterium UPWRP_1]|nr:hypothetical protein B6N25_15055 [Sphingobacteriales bacterium TSM_CSS]PSJ78742.1 hypothetical protein C7N43_01710 [Sphingobacteriales bacterium UPWRP_1]
MQWNNPTTYKKTENAVVGFSVPIITPFRIALCSTRLKLQWPVLRLFAAAMYPKPLYKAKKNALVKQ